MLIRELCPWIITFRRLALVPKKKKRQFDISNFKVYHISCNK